MRDGIKTTELDELAAETCSYLSLVHPEYAKLAARIEVNNLHKETKENFAEFIDDMYHHKDEKGNFRLFYIIFER